LNRDDDSDLHSPRYSFSEDTKCDDGWFVGTSRRTK
uniref:Sorbin and SH3 domain-containing protein 1 (Fragments) n=1 Tax=Rattus norvegicus TaxID=10116 RepID=SRBS1_RAT|nr:RecName: Full=Sorbin and SH3 domain-containing protein 1; AltName: Full=Ponsin; AltName: Full=SH3P12 [Rattus norvegicus]